MPNEVTEVIEKAFRKHCNKLGFHADHFPEFDQADILTICTARAFKVALKAGLLPADYQQGDDPAEYGEAEPERVVTHRDSLAGRRSRLGSADA